MKHPSAVSNRVMPPANSSGRASTAYQGRPWLAAAAVAASSSTSVAVSNPMPKISPTKNMCRVLVIERMNRPKNRHIRPRACSWRSSSASSNRPARRPRNTLRIPARTTTLSAAIR